MISFISIVEIRKDVDEFEDDFLLLDSARDYNIRFDKIGCPRPC